MSATPSLKSSTEDHENDLDTEHQRSATIPDCRTSKLMRGSLHADPEWEYPLFWGRADETGGGDGLGTTLNLPLPTGIDDATYLRHLDTALERVRAFAPRHLVVSAGFDTWKDDPLGTFRLTADGIGAIGAALADLALPTVIVQEGGYALRALGDLAMRFLRPFS